jgi:hypothetical protein
VNGGSVTVTVTVPVIPLPGTQSGTVIAVTSFPPANAVDGITAAASIAKTATQPSVLK